MAAAAAKKIAPNSHRRNVFGLTEFLGIAVFIASGLAGGRMQSRRRH